MIAAVSSDVTIKNVEDCKQLAELVYKCIEQLNNTILFFNKIPSSIESLTNQISLSNNLSAN